VRNVDFYNPPPSLRLNSMTTKPYTPDQEAPHEGPIKTPKQLVVTLVLAFVVPVIAIIMLASFVAVNTQPGAGSDGLGPEAVAARIAPVGTVEVKDASDASALASGDKVYAAQCAACHGTGAAGAPKLGDEAAWAPRVKTGYEALLESALKGKGNMGPQGGGDFTDLEIGRAVVYMANQAGAKLPEPQAPAAAASAPGT
jgi:cytochrome c5